ncbi:MAG: dethiobiotin synthase [Gallionella sp.]
MSYFVTGTDTGVGKTLISCALLQAFARQGKRVAGMKPIAAGCNADGQNEDALQLRAAGNVSVSYESVNPFCFPWPVAPHIAALRAGVIIDLSMIEKSYRELSALADVVIVEGAGGLLVPLNEQQDGADLVRQLALPVILVAGMRLGCLNHALLTVEAVTARGLALAGWVANMAETGMESAEDNIAALQQRIAAPLLGVVPHLPQPDAQIASAHLRVERLDRGLNGWTGRKLEIWPH